MGNDTVLSRRVSDLFRSLKMLLDTHAETLFSIVDPGANGFHLVSSDGFELHTNLSTKRRFTDENVYKSRQNRFRCKQLLDRYFLQLSNTIDNSLSRKHVVFFGDAYLDGQAAILTMLLQRGVTVVLIDEHLSSQLCGEHFIKLKTLSFEGVGVRCADCLNDKNIVSSI